MDDYWLNKNARDGANTMRIVNMQDDPWTLNNGHRTLADHCSDTNLTSCHSPMQVVRFRYLGVSVDLCYAQCGHEWLAGRRNTRRNNPKPRRCLLLGTLVPHNCHHSTQSWPRAHNVLQTMPSALFRLETISGVQLDAVSWGVR